MKALRYDRPGPPEVMTVADVPEPSAGPGQIRIAVQAAGVNPVDWKIRSGVSPQRVTFPRTPGLDAAGIVDQVGVGVSGVTVGDEVFGETLTGAAAEFAVLETFAVKPQRMSWAEAGGLPAPAETALRALEVLRVREGQRLLINGVAGGVGLAAAQFALARGLSVIGTASEPRHAALRDLGIVPTTYGPGLCDRVGPGVDVVLDAAGSGILPELIAVAGDASRVVTIADPDATRYGVIFTTGAEGRAWHALSEAAGLFEQGRFTLPVARTFALADGPAAHRLSEQRHVMGKLVILIGQ